jgi:hypothetical protein
MIGPHFPWCLDVCPCCVAAQCIGVTVQIDQVRDLLSKDGTFTVDTISKVTWGCYLLACDDLRRFLPFPGRAPSCLGIYWLHTCDV